MTSGKFPANDWINKLAAALSALAKVQEPYLEAHWGHNPPERKIVNGIDVTPFPLDDLRMIYESARYSRRFDEEEQYSPLLKALNPVRYALLSHPVLERVAVAGRLIGENDFWMQILNSGSSISAGHLIAGLMTHAAELSGDRFRTVARKLNAFLSPIGDEEAGSVLGPLDEGCNAMLFYGLVVTERINIGETMLILPHAEVRRFVDDKFLEELAPFRGFHDWQSVGAVAKPFRWRPMFRREGSINESTSRACSSFFTDAEAFLDLLAVTHAAPVVPLAVQHDCINLSAGRLLGMEGQSPRIYQGSPAQGFDGFAKCPALSARLLEDVQEVFANRKSGQYRNLASVVARLAQALTKNGRFAILDKILDVSIALEKMYNLPKQGVTNALAQQVSSFLGTDADSRGQISKSMRTFYNARSAIIHGRPAGATSIANDTAFVAGFDLAQRTLFKLLREGARVPSN